MTSDDRGQGPSPELRASLFHFTVFGTTGVASAYLAIWLSGKGISATEIGIINAVPVLLNLLLGVVIGRIADRASDWRTTIIALAMVAGVAPLGLFFVDGFWGLLIILTLVIYPVSALVPVIDSATLRMTERRGTDFGFVRAWGTVGYVATTATTGLIIAWLGAWTFLPLLLLWGMLRLLLSLPLPRFRGQQTHEEAETRVPSSVTLMSVMRPWFLLPCIAFALIQSTHFFLGSMGALVWKIDGIADGWIGPLMALGAAGEAIVMFFWRRIGSTMTARTMLIIAGLVATFRWAVMAFSPSLELLVVLQLLHAVTLPFSYFGIMHFIANWTPEDIAAEAQGFSSALTMGFLVVTLVAFGWLVQTIGGQTYLVAAGMALVGAGAAWLSLLLRPAHARSEAVSHG